MRMDQSQRDKLIMEQDQQQVVPVISSYGEEDDYDDEENEGSEEEDAKSQVVSQHPLSSMGNEGGGRRNEDGEDEEDEEEEDGRDEMDQIKTTLMPIIPRYLAPVVGYKVLFFVVAIGAPLIFTLGNFMVGNCKTAPHYASHIIFLTLQISLFGLSIWLHVKKWKSQIESLKKPSLFLSRTQDSSLLKSQGRCCRELITHMKLIDTYTNFCFIALLINSYFAINTSDQSQAKTDTQEPGAQSITYKIPAKEVPVYILVISLLSMAVYLMTKLIMIARLILRIVRSPANQ